LLVFAVMNFLFYTGISWSFIEFPDNQDVLDLIDDKRTGILNILDDLCLLSSSKNTESSFAEAMYKKCVAHPRFSASRKQQTYGLFSIQHYAGSVEYSTQNFFEKNKDELPKEATDLLLGSSNTFIQLLGYILSTTSESLVTTSGNSNNIVQNTPQRMGRSNKSSLVRVSVGGQFYMQLKQLRERISTTSPHYIRCIKPNDDLVPDKFECSVVLDQLRCNGILEAVRVSRVGYPHRFEHKHFVERYRLLGTKNDLACPVVPMTRQKSSSGFSDIKRECESLLQNFAQTIFADSNSSSGNTEEINTTGPNNTKQKSNERRITSPWREKGTSIASPERGKALLLYSRIDFVKIGIQMGKTKVFVKRSAFDILESLRGSKKSSAATKIAATVRMFLDRLHLIREHPELLSIVTAAPPEQDEPAVSDRELDYCSEAYGSSLAIALENARRNSRRSLLSHKMKDYKWIQVDGRWVKNVKLS
jgi:myosin heavy subunit